MPRRDLWRSALGGVLFAARVACFYLAVKRTVVADVVLIVALQPVLVLVVAGRWFGERVDAPRILWTLLAVGGVALTLTGSARAGLRSLSGDLFAVGALLAWTGFWLVSKHARADLGTTQYLAGAMLAGSIVMTPVVLLSGLGLEPLEASDWLWLGLNVLVPGGGGHLLMGWAHRYVPVSVSSLLTVITPLVGVVAAWLILDEPFGILQATGVALTIVSVAAVLRAHEVAVRRQALDVGGGSPDAT